MKPLSTARSLIPESGIRKLAEMSAQIPDAIHLEVGEPDFNTPDNVIEAAAQAMRSGFTTYTPVPGYMSLRKAISDDLSSSYGIKAETDEIIVTSGAVMSLAAGLLAITDPGDEILLPDPAWPVYEMILIAQQNEPVRYKLKPDQGFVPDFDDLEAKVTNKTKAIMINTPGNPTGGVFDEPTVKRLMEFANKHDLYVISDEVYDAIIFEGRHISPKAYDTEGRVISIFAVSKKYAMTGWRLGYAVAPKPVASLMGKIMVTLVGNAPSVSQKAAEEAITGPQDFVAATKLSYMTRRDLVYDMFVQAGIKAYKPNGAFYMMVDIADCGMPSEQFAIQMLQEEKVAVAPGSTFGDSSKHMIRLSFATEQSVLLEGVKRICNFIGRNRK